MAAWMLIWKIVLIVALALFAVLTVVTTIGGVCDIRKLFRRLRSGDGADDDRDVTAPGQH